MNFHDIQFFEIIEIESYYLTKDPINEEELPGIVNTTSTMSLQLGSRALLGVSSRTLEAARPMGVFQAFHTALSQRTLRLERRNGHLETQKYRWVVSAAAEVESGGRCR